MPAWNPAPAPAWTPPTPSPVAYPQPYGAPQGPSYPPPQGYAPPATQSVRPGGYGTVEMNLAVMHGVPTPMPPGPGGPPQIAPHAAPPKGGVSRGVWVLAALALLACGAMMVWARLRGAG